MRLYHDNSSGINNTALGYGTKLSNSLGTNQTVIGYEAQGQADNSVVLGNSEVTAIYMAQDAGATVYARGGNFTGDMTIGGDIFGYFRCKTQSKHCIAWCYLSKAATYRW